MGFEIFGFRALWSPYYLSVMVLLLVLYFMIIGPWRSKFKDSSPVSTKQQILFVSGIVALYVSKGSPVDLLGHIMFSAHMTQMAILYLIVPPLLILGIPEWLWRAILYRPIIKPVFKFFTKPILALIVFNGVFSVYHIPLVFDFVKTEPLYHALMTTIIFIAAIFMWLPLLNTLQEWDSLSGIKKMGYIFADGVLLTPACALIIFSPDPLYLTYSDPQAWINALHLCVPGDMLAGLNLTGPEMFNTLPLVDDQQLGGVLMKIIQEVVYGSILAYVFFEWARKERLKDELELQEDYRPEPIK
ncbi:cytochrome c oxidase assembly factor CtaG [Metabacillus niabensis]|uniref:Membrane protein n=1 Tax=Metabacillus niabensis TaxID=324854 RepID=A0ABT9Z507_9BACI|nr:cytochrome c oxidase assembly factor CtaG [Metabacillus niabensis]MDQ0227044.1 putative membrane protein [Metabacillus niabensis]PAD70097.1 cytochrome c oxidase assembly factor CtaG [Bacillus sp. 7586-K]